MIDNGRNIYGNRINALIEFIKDNSYVIDVGTDHAYLPIGLAQSRNCKGILAIDSRSKPLQNARENIDKYGLTNKIKLQKSDGLSGVELSGDETIVISGLGGYLISKILEQKAEQLTKNHTFILQPNWTWYELRKWLSENHFNIERERVVEDDHKLYSIIEAKLSDSKQYLSDVEAFVGVNFDKNTISNSKLLFEYYKRLYNIALKKKEGIPKYQIIAEQLSDLLNEMAN